MNSSSPVKPQSLQGRVGRVPSSLLRDDKDDPSLHDRPTASRPPDGNIVRAGLDTLLRLLAPLFVLGAIVMPLRAQSSAPEVLQRALHFADLYNWTDAAPEFSEAEKPAINATPYLPDWAKSERPVSSVIWLRPQPSSQPSSRPTLSSKPTNRCGCSA
jgi:hypothetical protein